jgi:cyclophilin family peptidyl-prolyl cis-trans isomerase
VVQGEGLDSDHIYRVAMRGLTKGNTMFRRTFIAAFGLCLLAKGASAQTPATPLPLPPPLPAPKVTLTTTMGAIEITLDPVGAPKTSAHMLKLFQSTHYVGAAVYRIEPGFLIQLGDLDTTFQHRWAPRPLMGKTVELETATNKHGRGTVSLARADDPNSGMSTFYFDLGENASLNATAGAPPDTTGYATFGRVTAGMAVLDAIAAAPRAPTGGPFPGKAPLVPITITGVVTDPPAPPAPRVEPGPVPKAKAKGRVR